MLNGIIGVLLAVVELMDITGVILKTNTMFSIEISRYQRPRFVYCYQCPYRSVGRVSIILRLDSNVESGKSPPGLEVHTTIIAVAYIESTASRLF